MEQRLRRTVLLISGSLQASSVNRSALDVIRASLTGSVQIEVVEAIDLGTIPAFNPETSAPDESVETLRGQLADADAVVVATPEYAGSLPGSLKNAFDWIVGSGELYAKPVAVVSAGTSGGVHARHHLIQSLTWQGAHVVASLGIASPRTKSDSTGRFTDPATLAALVDVAAVAAAAPDLTPAQRMARIMSVLEPLGIDAVHVAPMPDRPAERPDGDR